MKETTHVPVTAGGLWIASGELTFDAGDLAATIGDPSGDKVLRHRVRFSKDSRPSSPPHVQLALSGMKSRGVPHYRLTTGKVCLDGFEILIGREGGTAIAFCGVSWTAIGANGAAHE